MLYIAAATIGTVQEDGERVRLGHGAHSGASCVATASSRRDGANQLVQLPGERSLAHILDVERESARRRSAADGERVPHNGERRHLQVHVLAGIVLEATDGREDQTS